MLIDWFTVAAQVVNFLILVWLMKRFLFKPITSAIDEREKHIAAELADADAKKTNAEKERVEFENKNEDFDQQRAALMSKATGEAKAEHVRLFEQARKDADDMRAGQAAALRNEQTRLSGEITRLAAEQVFDIARRALSDLANVSLEERVGEVFIRRLRALNGNDREALGLALKTTSEAALMRSAFDLPAEQRAAIQNALNETFAAEIHIQFETALSAICGIELTANGQKLEWSINGYLKSLDEKVVALLDTQSPNTQTDAQPKTDETSKADAGGAGTLKSAAQAVTQ
jgi:F-type H+-transporting ATPase subunit b